MSLLHHDATDELIEAQLPPVERRWLKWLRRTGWTLVALYFVVAIAMLSLRFWVLPAVADYKPQIEAAVSRALDARVEIGAITADWSGFHPSLELTGVKIFDRRGKEALGLQYVGVTLAWRSVLAGELRFRSIVLDRPSLVVRRDPQGRFFVAGLEMEPEERSDGVAGDWLFKQGEIIVRTATVEWQDERRRAVPLRLESVDFLLQNDGRHHRFALRAEPPRELGAPIEIRGDLVGRTVAELESWNGRVYAAFDHVDLAVWQAWVDYPFEVRSGRGALRLWLGFADRTLTELTASVALDDVAGRLSPELPPLEMKSLRGQFGAKKTTRFELIDLDGVPDVVYEGFARQLALVMKDDVAVAPADFTAQWQPAQGKQPARGELAVRAIELGPLAHIGEYVPLPGDARQALIAAAPKGRVSDVSFAWTGEIERPDTYTARGKFADLGMKPYGAVPGFERLAGGFDVADKGGTVTLQSSATTVESAKLFPAGAIAFDSLAARVSWTFPQGDLLVKLDDVAFANADIAGSLSGTYRGDAKGARGVDLTGRLARIEGRQVYRYIPRLDAEVVTFLKHRLQAGTAAGETRWRFRGDPRDFPFRDPATGEFKISGRVTGGTLEYADGWPKLTNVTADLVFDGPKLKISSSRANVLGTQIANAVVTLPDMYRDRTDVIVDGEVNGPLGEFLKFIAQSPVRGFVDGLTDQWSGEGRASLKLHLALPLYAIEKSTAAGSFQFANNSIALGPGEPSLTQVNGRVEFTDTGVSARGLTAQTLGGNISLALATRDAVTTGVIQGTVDARELARTVELPVADRLRGPMPFKYTMTSGRGRTGSSVFESPLTGVAIDLPAPFAKPAAESVPFRLERTVTAPSPRRETIALAFGAVLNARGDVRYEDGKMFIERAGVGIGDVGVPVPERPGVFIAGNLKTLDFDRLLAAATDAGEKAGRAEFNVTALSMRAGTLVAIGREFHDVAVRAQFDGRRTWRADVTARELAGEIAWRSEGQGLVRARLKHLIQPDRAPGGSAQDDAASELPALAIIADSYTFNGNELGRLELRAVNEAKGWRLDKLELASAEGTLSATGLWNPARGAGRTELEVKADVKDVGKYLERFGYPETVAKGTATLAGTVQWAGPVYRIDYGTLVGSLDLKAEKGQFVKVQPGVGRLLGVLSLQSLPRRMSLDFRDVFSEGFAFDSINGSAKIAQGVASTDNLAMTGPAASVAIAGRADLAKETQDLTVRVVPVLGDSVAVAAGVALLNPIVGAGALIAQRLFKDPLGQMFAYEYQVTGSWEDPKVVRVRAPEVATPGPGGTTAAPESGDRPAPEKP